MSILTQGCNPFQVDTVAQFPIGEEQPDPRGGQLAGNVIKYVQANGTIPVFSAVKSDVTFTTASQRHAVVIVTAGAGSFEGVSDLANTNQATPANVTTGQFFWITVKGRATVLSATSTAGTAQGTAAAGNLNDLTTVTSAQAVGKTAIAMSATGTPAALQAFVLIT